MFTDYGYIGIVNGEEMLFSSDTDYYEYIATFES